MLSSTQAVRIQNSDLLWPLYSLAYSLVRLSCHFSLTLCHLSLVISHVSPLQILWHAYTDAHINICYQQADFTSRDFYCCEYKVTKQSCVCYVRSTLFDVHIEKNKTIRSFRSRHCVDFYTLHFNSNHKTKVVSNCDETTSNRNEGWKRKFDGTQMENTPY